MFLMMGRLWQTLILSEWRPKLAWLPIETLIKDKQSDYYQALREADAAGDSTGFIIFILLIIKRALQESIHVNSISSLRLSEKMSEEMSEENPYNKLNTTAKNILTALKTHPHLTIAQLAEHLKVSTRTVERQLHTLQEKGLLKRKGSTKSGYWQVEVTN